MAGRKYRRQDRRRGALARREEDVKKWMAADKSTTKDDGEKTAKKLAIAQKDVENLYLKLGVKTGASP